MQSSACHMGRKAARGQYFFYEDGKHCNCPRDDCEEVKWECRRPRATVQACELGDMRIAPARHGKSDEEVHNKGCSSYINMDDPRYGKPGGNITADCADAVQRLHGKGRLQGPIFLYEDGKHCNCPRDDCEEGPNGNAGGQGNCTSLPVNLATCRIAPASWQKSMKKCTTKDAVATLRMDDVHGKPGGQYSLQDCADAPAPAWEGRLQGPIFL